MAKYYHFDRILEDTDIRDICGYFTTVVKGDKAHCPEPGHMDKRPSCRLFPKENKYYCQSCGGYGSGIDVVARNLNLTAIEACEWLINQFGLNEENYIDYSRSGDKRYCSKTAKTGNKYYINAKRCEAFGIISNNINIPVNCYEYKDDVIEHDLKQLSPFQLKELKEKVISVLPEELKSRTIITNKVKWSSHDLSEYNGYIIFKANQYSLDWDDIRNRMKSIGAGKMKRFGNMMCIYINPRKQLINIGIYDSEYVVYQQICKNPLQSLYDEDKEAFNFLIKSKAINKLSEIAELKNNISSFGSGINSAMDDIICELASMNMESQCIIACLDEMVDNIKKTYFDLTGEKLPDIV